MGSFRPRLARRSHGRHQAPCSGEDSIFFAPSRKCWVGEITVGWKPDSRRDRITVRGKTKTDVKNKLS
jgi:hypothetical protein